MQSFVALDLELTPFSADQQRIIEIAAVRFRDSRVADTFSTLVDPCCGLTPRIAVLTGISQHQVDAAPPIEAVIPSLRAFLGSDPLVGQSVELDLQKLVLHGVRPGGPVYDTFELASLLLPGLPSYDLATIARALEVEPEQEHRALGDALVAGRVFLGLLDRAGRLGPEVLAQIGALAASLPGWAPADLFSEAQRRQLRHHFDGERRVGSGERGRGDGGTGGRGDAGTRRRGDEHPVLSPQSSVLSPEDPDPPSHQRQATSVVPVKLAELRSLLQPGGAVASVLPGFEERGEQLMMMEEVTRVLNEGGHLLAEAGTGTGKSLAYLLPAVYYAVRNGRPVVVSTNTLNLQDQLYQKDLPALHASLPLRFKAALLKGRANYLCMRRWLVLARTPNLGPEETMLLIKTLVWLSSTETGDRAELNLSPAEAALWLRISAQAESCALARCPQFRRGACFVTRARRSAESAHVIVVNHALLLSDLANTGGVLPEYSHLIVDEAHHLEEEATEQLGFTLSWSDVSSFLASLHQIGPGRHPAGFLADLAVALRERQTSREAVQRIRTLVSTAQAAAEAALGETRSFFEELDCFLHDHADDRGQGGGRLRITGSVRVQPAWSEIEVRWAELAIRLQALRRLLGRLSEEVEALGDGQLLEREGVLAELAGFDSYLDRLRAQGGEIVSAPSENGIYWISGGLTREDLALRSAPLHVGEALNSALFSCKESVILTSATLTAEGSFDYVRERLGLENARELMVGSPFDYRNSTMLFVVRDIPEPARPSYQRSVETAIADLALALEGRTLVLFTSHAQLRTTAGAIRSRLEQQGILLLAHGLDGSRRRLLQAFKSSPKAVLMGTSSFWEGIDVVGEALSCLIIVKLPFAVPTDPIFAARSEVFDEPFRQYSVPQTILRFKQGFGRLIRSRTDRGVVAILDSRLGTKFYGPSFIHSLPECTLRTGSAQHAAESARAWLGDK